MHITLQELKMLVQEPYFTRGKEYFNDQLIELISIKSNQLKARVAGSTIYYVSITRTHKSIIVGKCSCIAFSDYGPCKHIAATGLAFIEYSNSNYKPSEEYFDQVSVLDNIEDFLNQKTKKKLISLILTFAHDYPEVMEDLNFMADED